MSHSGSAAEPASAQSVQEPDGDTYVRQLDWPPGWGVAVVPEEAGAGQRRDQAVPPCRKSMAACCRLRCPQPLRTCRCAACSRLCSVRPVLADRAARRACSCSRERHRRDVTGQPAPAGRSAPHGRDCAARRSPACGQCAAQRAAHANASTSRSLQPGQQCCSKPSAAAWPCFGRQSCKGAFAATWERKAAPAGACFSDTCYDPSDCRIITTPELSRSTPGSSTC